MIILPSIDLMNGACIRLKQGDFNQQTLYEVTPEAMAMQFKAQGAQGMHMVDLQGAKFGKLMQASLMTAVAKAFGPGVQAGGGVRCREEVDTLLDGGVTRVVIGTRAVTSPQEIALWINEYGIEHLVFALDCRLKEGIPYIATSGWQTDSLLTLWDGLALLPQGSHVLCTDIGQDGMQQGPNLSLYQMCVQRYPDLFFQASGGVGSLQDIRALKKLNMSAAIIGKALYEEKLLLSEAIACSNDASFRA